MGNADAKEIVNVTLNGISQSATTDKSGKWEIVLPALEAGAFYGTGKRQRERNLI